MKKENVLFSIARKKVSEDNSESIFLIIAEILQIENCRISEILSANWQDYHAHRFLILKGKKKSSPVVIRDRILLEKISKIPRTTGQLIFGCVNYRQVYHFIKSKYSHLFTNIKTRKNQKVTHAFRYINCRAIDNDEEIKVILHHNSLKSGKYYKNKIKGV